MASLQPTGIMREACTVSDCLCSDHSCPRIQRLFHSSTIAFVFSGGGGSCLALSADFERSHHRAVHVVQALELISVVILQLLPCHSDWQFAQQVDKGTRGGSPLFLPIWQPYASEV